MRCLRTLTGMVQGCARRLQDAGVMVLLAGLLWAAMAWGQSYQFTDLGYFIPEAINNNGSLAGVVFPGHAARWRAGQALEDFGGIMAAATAINASDVAAGYTGGVVHWSDAVWWRKDGTRLMWPVPPGANFARAAALNRRGWACGMAEIPMGSSRAALFNSQALLLPDYAEGTTGLASERPSYCEAISGMGWMVGTATAPDRHLHAMLWDSPTTFRDMHTTSPLGDDPSAQSWGCCITEDNDSAGSIHDSTGLHAWRWVKGPLEILPDLPGLPSCGASGMNPAGEVVGSCGLSVPGLVSHGVLWDVTGMPFDLNTIAQVPQGWTIIKAAAINDHGEIACVAQVAGDQQAHGCFLEPLMETSQR